MSYEKLLSQITEYKPPENYPEDYFTYLRAYASDVVFNKEKLDKELAMVKDTLSAVDFAIRREQDSIFYYHELRPLVPEEQAGLIDKVINEERKHFLELTEIKQPLEKE